MADSTKKKDTEERTSTSLLLRVKLKSEVEHAKADGKVDSLQAAIETGLELLLASLDSGKRSQSDRTTTGVTKPPDPLTNPREKPIRTVQSPEHEQLDRILRGGHPPAVKAITTNLVAFDELTSLAKAKGDGGTANHASGEEGRNITPTMEQIHLNEEALKRDVQALGHGRKTLAKRKKRTPRKTSGGSGD